MRPYFVYGFVMIIALAGGIYLVRADTVSGSATDIQSLNRQIAAHQTTISQLEKTMDKYKNVITATQTKAVSLKNQLDILGNHIAQVQTDVELTREKIDETQLEIQRLQLSINDKEQTMARQKKIISQMVKSIQQGDQKNYLEIMLTYNNFSDFYNEVQSTQNVYVDLGRSVKTLRIIKEDLDSQRQQQQAKQKSYQDLRTQLDGKKDDLNKQVTAKQQLLTETHSSEQRYQTLLSNLRRQYQQTVDEERAIEDKVRQQLKEADKIQADGNVVFSWPAPSHYINAGFHDPSYPFRAVFQHSGIDIKASQGTPVHAAASGYVARARHCTTAACYSYILIVHTATISSLYGHLSGINVAEDQFVHRGDVIGFSGGTPGAVGSGPFVTGPHLHFEVRLNGIPVDPMGYLGQ